MLTWANFFTSIRVFVAPAFFYFIITGNPTHTRVALVLFGAAALTDFFDGYVARKFSEVTEFGKFLDTSFCSLRAQSRTIQPNYLPRPKSGNEFPRF